MPNEIRRKDSGFLLAKNDFPKYLCTLKPDHQTKMSENATCSLYEILKTVAAGQPDRTALTYFGINLTYSTLLDRINETAKAFKNFGVGQGDIVSLALPTIPESVMCFYALHKIGAIPCMIDVRFTPEKMCEIADRTNSKMLFIMGFGCKSWAKTKVKTNLEKVVVCSGADSIPGVSFWYRVGEWFNGRKQVFLKNRKFCHWKDFYKAAQGKDDSEFYLWKPDEMAALFQTSGTTGTVKSVMLTTENILHAVFPNPPVLNDISPDDSAICFLPIFAFYGANAVILAFSHGMRAVVIPIATKEAFLKLIVKHKPQHVFSVPAYWDIIAQEKDNTDDFSFLKTVNIAGDVLNTAFERSINDFLRTRGCRCEVTKAYGMTETAGVISFTPQGSPHQYEPGFSGKVVEGYEVKVFDDELCVRSEMKILGYYKNEEATENLIQTHEDGSRWIHTGDMGRVDDEGNIFVIGRKKRMIVRHDGSKVFPVEIEDCIVQHSLVASCAVVPTQDPDHSESKLPKAFVVLKDTNKKAPATAEALMFYCKTHLPEHLIPAAIEFIDTLPMNSNGKVDYKKLSDD